MIAYEMGSSPAMVYTVVKISPMENFKRGWKNDMAINMIMFFLANGVLQRSRFLCNLKPPNNKLGLQRSPTRGFFCNN